MRTLTLLLTTAALSLGALQGCATAVVGGAATGAAVIHDRRSAGAALDDQTIELQVLNKRLNNARLQENSNLAATSYNYRVLLTGQANSEAYRSEFESMVRSVKNVKEIINEVSIGPNASITEQSTDSWITAKAKVELLKIKMEGFDPTRVKVVTEKGSVFLMGVVTVQEAEAVVEKIRYLSGVNRVVKVFEYL